MNTETVEVIRFDMLTLERHLDDLCGVLLDTVEDGAAVSFMAPLGRGDAEQFWQRDVGTALGNGARLLFGALVDGKVVGTVQLMVSLPPNQPHRAEISKMMVHPTHRQRGIGKRLLNAAFEAARGAGKTLVTLDTRTGDVSEKLYKAVGFERAGEIPDFALDPDGQALHATTYMYKRL